MSSKVRVEAKDLQRVTEKVIRSPGKREGQLTSLRQKKSKKDA